MIWDPNIGDANNIAQTLEHLHRDIGQLGLFMLVVIFVVIFFSSSCKYKKPEAN